MFRDKWFLWKSYKHFEESLVCHYQRLHQLQHSNVNGKMCFYYLLELQICHHIQLIQRKNVLFRSLSHDLFSKTWELRIRKLQENINKEITWLASIINIRWWDFDKKESLGVIGASRFGTFRSESPSTVVKLNHHKTTH